MLTINIVISCTFQIFITFPVLTVTATLTILYWLETYMSLSFPLIFSRIFLQLTLDAYRAF